MVKVAKYRVTAKGSLVTVKSKLTKKDIVSTREIEFLMGTYIKGLFKITYDGKRTIEYTAPMASTLEKFLKNYMIDDLCFWRIIAQILQISMYMELSGLNPNNMWMDISAVFINNSTKDLYFIYQPFVTVQNQGNAFSLIQDITQLELKKTPDEQRQYLLEFQNFLGQGNQYRMEVIKQYVEKVYPEMRIMEQEIYRPGKSEYILQTPVYRHCDAKVMEENDTVCLQEEGTVVLGYAQTDEDDAYGATTLLVHKNEKKLFLVRQKDNERIQISGKAFRIGKDNENDYMIKGNTAVSRKHAVVTMSDGEYYLEDKNSTNGTFVNGVRVETSEKILLKDGDEVIFADDIYMIQTE